MLDMGNMGGTEMHVPDLLGWKSDFLEVGCGGKGILVFNYMIMWKNTWFCISNAVFVVDGGGDLSAAPNVEAIVTALIGLMLLIGVIGEILLKRLLIDSWKGWSKSTT